MLGSSPAIDSSFNMRVPFLEKQAACKAVGMALVRSIRITRTHTPCTLNPWRDKLTVNQWALVPEQVRIL